MNWFTAARANGTGCPRVWLRRGLPTLAYPQVRDPRKVPLPADRPPFPNIRGISHLQIRVRVVRRNPVRPPETVLRAVRVRRPGAPRPASRPACPLSSSFQQPDVRPVRRQAVLRDHPAAGADAPAAAPSADASLRCAPSSPASVRALLPEQRHAQIVPGFSAATRSRTSASRATVKSPRSRSALLDGSVGRRSSAGPQRVCRARCRGERHERRRIRPPRRPRAR